MSRLIITTLGTSLLTNRGWRRGAELPDPVETDQYLVTAAAAAASAETNTLQGLSLNGQDWLELLHSDTPEGRFCAQRLLTYYQHQCRDVKLREITALNYHHQSFAQAGLKSLVQQVFAILNDQSRPGLPLPVFAATGGFKAEIAFLNLLGALLDIEVYYIHDQFRELVRLPRLPLTWDTEYVVRNQDFFNWIDAEPRSSIAAESWLKGRPELRSLVNENADGHTYLNAAGDLIFQAAKSVQQQQPRALWPDADSRPPETKNHLSSVDHHRPNGWEHAVNWLCSIDCVTGVFYDEGAYGGTRVKSMNGRQGKIGVRYGSSDKCLPLRVETTACSQAQTDLVGEYLRRRFK